MHRILALLTALCLAAPVAVASAQGPALRSPGFTGGTPRVEAVPVAPPAVRLAATGEDPDLIVDAAGTAHIVWNEDRFPNGPDVTVYCRLPRAARACEVVHRLIPPLTTPGADPIFASDTAGPAIVAVNDQVAVLSFRFPYPVPKPEGDQASTLHLWTSDDGGRTFGNPGVIGTQAPSGDAVVFGSPEAPFIGSLSAVQTGGTVLQSIRSGAFSDARAVIGPGDLAYEGTAAVVDRRPVVAFEGLGGGIRVRSWTGAGDPNDVATWTPAREIPGSQPRIAATGNRPFLLYRPASGAPFRLLDLTSGSNAAVTPADVGFDRAIAGDPEGGLTVGYRLGVSGRYYIRRIRPGAPADPPVLVATGVQVTTLTAIDAAFDGGGVAAFPDATGGISVAAFGPRGSTGRTGLGGQPGGGAVGADVVLDCGRVRVGAVRAALPAGCFFGAVRGGARVTESTLRLNGLEIVPDPGVQVVIDPRARRIYSTGRVRVLLRAPGVPDITLFAGRLGIELATARVGDSLFRFPDSVFRPVIRGFPVAGDVDVRITSNGVRIPVNLRLPPAFGGVRGDAVLVADMERGLRLDSLRFEVERALIGPVELRRLKVAYSQGPSRVEVGCIRPVQSEFSEGDSWSGEFELGFPPRPTGANLCGSIRFSAGAFRGTTFRLDLPYPGITLFPGVSLLSLGGGLALEPLRLTAATRLGAIPVAAGEALVTVDGRFDATFGTPFTLTATGEQRVAGVRVGDGTFTMSSDGYVRVVAAGGFSVPGILIGGQVTGFLDGPRREFSLGARTRACVDAFGGGACVEGAGVVVSTRGVAVCLPPPTTPRGGGYRWGATLPSVWLFSCDTSDYEVSDTRVAGAGIRALQSTPGFTVAPGQEWTAVRVRGEGGVPQVTLVDPSGAPVAADATAVSPEEGVLFVGVRNPAPGAWTVTANPGSVPVAGVDVSRPVVPAAVSSARVTGSGTRRVLRYTARIGPDQSILVLERGAAGTRVLGGLRDGRGTLAFTPGPGPGGARQIVAMPQQGGLARSESVVARYVAPAPARPGPVRGLRARRAGGALVATWVPVRGASAHVVGVTLPGGDTVLRVLGPRAGRVTVRIPVRPRAVAGVTRVLPPRVAVAAIDRQGRRGRGAVAVVRTR